MKTWEEYKKHAAESDAEAAKDIAEMECLAEIVTQVIERRNSLGMSQRSLAELCGIPQSSVARMESLQTTPKLDTLIKVMQPLGLKLVVTASED